MRNRASRPAQFGPRIPRLLAAHRTAPHIDISLHTCLAGGARVRVLLASTNGGSIVGSFTDDKAGNTAASLHASSLSHITSLRVVDRRPVATNEARDSLFAHADAAFLPRDVDRTMSARDAEPPCDGQPLAGTRTRLC